MTGKEKVLDKIRKLLAKANGTENEYEAAAFAERAHALLTEHNLSLSDVDEGGKDGEFVIDNSTPKTNSFPWRRRIGTAVGKLYFCQYWFTYDYEQRSPGARTYKRSDIHNFAGAPHNVAVAKLMFTYLVDTVDRLAREGARKVDQKERAKYITSFQHACSLRLTKRIWDRIQAARMGEAKTESGTTLPALADLYDQTQKMLDEFLKDEGLVDLEVSTKQSHLLGRLEGALAGEKIGLDTQVSGTAAAAHLLGSA